MTTSEVSGAGLPARLTTLLGRERETDDVRSLLASHRLVVLTGSGGCGKTRLATHVASLLGEGYPGGVVWVDLSGTSRPADVPVAVAGAVGVSKPFGGSLLDAVATQLKAERTLLLLDNCEHVVDACAGVVTELMLRCEHLSILATSRASLGVEGEALFRVPSLDTDGEASDAVRLFVDRAMLARHDFELTADNGATVTSICHRLDGIPLAIELAAARVRMHDLGQIALGLDDRFDLLASPGRGIAARQRTLEASVGWSFDLLDQRERAILERLSVLQGSFTLEAAEAVVADLGLGRRDVRDGVSVLIDQSLVEPDVVPSGTRYRLLETIRAYAAERLETDADAGTSARERHMDYYRALADRAEDLVRGGGAFSALELLEPEEQNLVAALDRAERSGDTDTLVAIAANAWWDLSGRTTPAFDALRRLLDGDRCPPELEPTATLAAARLASSRWDLTATEVLGSRALELARDAGDDRIAGETLAILGAASLWIGKREQAVAMLQEAREVAERVGDGGALASALVALGQVPFAIGDLGRARLLLETAADAARRYGHLRAEFEADMYLFLIHWFAGRDAAAEQVRDDGLAIARRCRLAFGESHCLSFEAAVHTRRGALEEAGRSLDEAWSLAEVSGHPLAYAHHQTQRALLHLARGDLEAALADFEACAAAARALSVPIAGLHNAAYAAEVAYALGQEARASANLDAASTWEGEIGTLFPQVARVEALVALGKGALDRAEERAHEAIARATASENDLVVLQALEVVAHVWARRGKAPEAARLLGALDAARRDRRWCPPPPARDLFERSMAEAKEVLGEESFERSFADGAEVRLQDAAAYARRGRGERKRPAFGWDSLTPSELKVAELVSEGLSNADIAARLFVTLATVKTHLTHIYAKLGSASRVQLAKAYMDNIAAG